MVCWLTLLPRISDMLKQEEPSLAKRKRLAIEILKELEKEEGHDLAKIKAALDREGKEGMLKRARKRKKAREEEAEREEWQLEEVEEERAES